MKLLIYGKIALRRILSAKLLLIMRLIAILLFAGVLQVNATNTAAQKITYVKRNVPLRKIFSAIQQQSGLSLLYDNKLIRPLKNIDIEIKDASVEEALNTCLHGLGLTYAIMDRIIVISAKPGTDAKTPPQTIRGVIKDENGVPMVGATVYVQQLKRGATTNDNGEFILSDVPPGNYTLAISSVGYALEERPVTVNGETVNIALSMKRSADKLQDAVVVTALGIKKASRSVAYNVQLIDGNEVNEVKDPSFVNSLNGKIAGATINSSSSGIAGSTRVILRGIKSLTGNNNALYVVDGIPLPNLFTGQPGGLFSGTDGGDGISNFNPDDIESISVLTGAAAAALYGSQAANGVILVTTKKGTANRTRVGFSSNSTAYSPLILPKFQNEYGATAAGSYTSWGTKLSQPSTYKPADFFQTGDNFSNSVNVSTGSEKSLTYFSAASDNARGVIPNNTFSRYNFTARNTGSMFDGKLNLDIGAMYLLQDQQNVPGQGQYSNPLVPIYLFPPSDTIGNYKQYQRFNVTRNFPTQYWPFGDLGFEMQNPYWIINKEHFETKRERFMGTVALKYSITKDLNIAARVKYDKTTDAGSAKYYASTINFIAGGPDGGYSNSTTNNRQTYADVLLNYDTRFSNFSLDATAGGSILNNETDATSAGGPLLTIPNYFSLVNISTTNLSIGQTVPQKNQTQAVFFSGTLGYKQKLFLEATARTDWASALAYTNSGSIFYPSAGLSGILSDMLRLPAFISYAKLRTSLSAVGNAPPPYISNPTYGITSNALTPYTTKPFTTLRPEKTASFEAGFDLRFLQDRLSLSTTFYDANTSNQLFTVSVPSATGFTGYYVNAGKVRNEGVEATLGYNGRFGGLHWTPAVTFSLNRNKILQMLPPFTDPFTGKLTSQDSLVVNSAGAYEMMITRGGTTGDIYAEGLQKNAQGGYVTNSQGLPVVSTTYTKVGKVAPDYNVGFNNGFTFKNFNLNFLITARVGGTVISATQSILDYYGVSRNSAVARDKGGVYFNGNLVSAKAYYGATAAASGGSTGAMALYTYSATNVRLGELSFGYTIPARVFNNKIQALKVALVARNLWMIYNKAPYDPESVASTGTYYQGFDYFTSPSLRNIGLHVSLSF